MSSNLPLVAGAGLTLAAGLVFWALFKPSMVATGAAATVPVPVAH